MKTIYVATVLTLLLSFAGCSSFRITSSWKAKDAVSRNYNKIMVVGIIREADRTVRVQMENHLAGDLRDLGYNAFSAYEEYGPKTFQNLTEEEVNAILAEKGIDAVLTVVLLDKQRERHYVTGRVMSSPYAIYNDHFWGYYQSLHTRVGMVGYYEESTKYFWESNFYDLHDRKLLFSVQTQSFDPSSTSRLAHEYGKKIIQSMVKNKLIEKREQKAGAAT